MNQSLRDARHSVSQALTKTLSMKAVEETARRLHFWESGRIVFPSEDGVLALNDAALFDYYPDKKRNAVERYALRSPYGAGTDEQRLLDAMNASRVTLVELDVPAGDAPVTLKDLLFERDFVFLTDEETATSPPQGKSTFVCRVLDLHPVAMISGVPRSIDAALAATIATSLRETILRGTNAEHLDSRTRSRLGQLLFQLALLDPQDARIRLDAIALAARLHDEK